MVRTAWWSPWSAVLKVSPITWLLSLTGRRARLLTSFPAVEGDELTIDAAWFIPDNWAGLIVIGWSGCLEGFRFALDPTPDNEHFYFDEYSDGSASSLNDS
jgi:hypothetical protein